MEIKEKKRSANFTAAEVETLLKIVVKHRKIIENKGTDKVYANEKAAAWLEIEKEFNCASTNICRTAGVLKKKLENLKKTTKLKYPDGKKNIYSSEGGPAQNINNMDQPLHDPLESQIDGLLSIYDSDFIKQSQSDTENDDENATCSTQVKEEKEDIPSQQANTDSAIDFDNYQQPNRKKRLLKKATACEKWRELADIKIKIAGEQLIHNREIHKLQMKQMTKEHEAKIKLLESQLLPPY